MKTENVFDDFKFPLMSLVRHRTNSTGCFYVSNRFLMDGKIHSRWYVVQWIDVRGNYQQTHLAEQELEAAEPLP